MGERIAIGGIWHETNTFARELTRMVDFANYQLARGDEIFNRYTGSNTELGGVIEAGRHHDMELLPTLYAGAVPSGTIEKQTLDTLGDELVERVAAAGPLNGAVMTMHGAAAAESIPDADAHVLARVRDTLGPDIPLVATYDFHANLSDEMVSSADILIGYDTFPHVDMAERGREAGDLVHQLMRDDKRPTGALRRVPLLTVPQMQCTDREPGLRLMTQLHEIEQRAGILCASLALGFPYSDAEHLGANVLVYAWDEAQAADAADEMADSIWEKRVEFTPELTAVDTGVLEAMESDLNPVILVEPADNVGGGAAGDCAVILESLVRLGAQGAVMVIADPQAVMQAAQAGVGGKFRVHVGGKSDDKHGPSFELDGVVTQITDASYTHKGSYMTGFVTKMGLTAVVETAGNQVVLTSLRTMPFDAEQLRCLGIEPASQAMIVVKSAMAWRSAYGDVAKRMIFLDTPGVCASNLEHFHYQNLPRPVFPLDPDTPKLRP